VEQPGFIPTDAGDSLFNVLHLPETEPSCCVLLCPAWGDEHRSAYGATVRIARFLADKGVAVLRFDYSGCGDSSGESSQITLSTLKSDITCAAEALKNRFPSLPLILSGVRIGGDLALELADSLAASRVAAIAPVLRGTTWLGRERGRKRLRESMIRREASSSSATGQSVVKPSTKLPGNLAEDLGGVPISKTMLSELEKHDLLTRKFQPCNAETLLIQVSPRKTPLSETQELAEKLNSTVACLHIEPFWQPMEPGNLQPLFEVLLNFLPGATS
jgi:pimeloyl-ACP methyl ester carboxylesterase